MFKLKKNNNEVDVPQGTDVALNRNQSKRFKIIKLFMWLIGIYLVACILLGIYWSREPKLFSVVENTQQEAQALKLKADELPKGFATVTTLQKVATTLLDKPGGYLSNDVMPPSLWLDNIPSWEYGVLVQVRDMTRALRSDFSRSQSQSTENAELIRAEENFNASSTSWVFPPAEDRYLSGVQDLEKYKKQLLDTNSVSSKFYPRADNLNTWLRGVETRLGSMSQRLSASVGQERIDLDLASNKATQANAANDGSAPVKENTIAVKTPWTQLDNVFYEARGQAWALVHLLRAIEVDFHDVLAKKNALVSLQQIIRELEATQQTLWSPMILNGSGFGFFANHSLVMANYISRANAGVIELRRLLEQG